MAGLGAGATGCEEMVVCDPLPPPNSDRDRTGDTEPGDPGPGDTQQGETDKGDGDGMVVCDPLPPPDGGKGD